MRQLESSGESEIPSEQIGELVMEALAELDQVAYVRFASVYRNFREAKDFGEFIGRIAAPTPRTIDRAIRPTNRMSDMQHMRAALALARRGLGTLGPIRRSAASW